MALQPVGFGQLVGTVKHLLVVLHLVGGVAERRERAVQDDIGVAHDQLVGLAPTGERVPGSRGGRRDGDISPVAVLLRIRKRRSPCGNLPLVPVGHGMHIAVVVDADDRRSIGGDIGLLERLGREAGSGLGRSFGLRAGGAGHLIHAVLGVPFVLYVLEEMPDGVSGVISRGIVARDCDRIVRHGSGQPRPTIPHIAYL